MSIAHNTIESIANAGASAGSQSGALTAKLAGGGYVVAWTSTVPGDATGGNVQFRIFDANGNAVGAIQAASAQPANNETMQDIIANGDGSFSIAYTTTGVAAATAPSGYAAIGSLTQIGVVRTFNATGTAVGSETRVGVAGAEELVNSMKLVAVNNTNVAVYFTQKDASTLAGSIYKTANIATSGPNVAIASSTIKTYDGGANPLPANELKILDVTQNTASSDLILATNRALFSDNPTLELAQPNTANSFAKVADGLYIRLSTLGNSGNVTTLEPAMFSAAGNNAQQLADIGTAQISLDLSTLDISGTIKATRIEALGNGKFLLAWSADFNGQTSVVGFGAQTRDGIYGTVFNVNTMAFEGAPALLLEGNYAAIGLDTLADGRVVVTGSRNDGFFGGLEAVQRIFDPRDADLDSTPYFQGLSFASATTGFRVDFETPEFNTGPAAAFPAGGFGGFNAYTNLIGGAGADHISGDGDANTLKGGGGGDIIDGRSGSDTLFGGTGDDTIDGGAGFDTIDGGANNDTLSGGADNDRMLGGTGNDGMDGGDGNDGLDGGDGNDTMKGGAGDDQMAGGAGNDWLRGNDGTDTAIGGLGNDVIIGGVGDDILDGGDGDDYFYLAESPTPTETGADVVSGGAGSDTISYAKTTQSLFIDLSGAADPDPFDAFSDLIDIFTSIENAVGSDAADMIIGTSGVNKLQGRGGNDIINAGAGDDTLIGGLGQDTMSGSSGADTFRYLSKAEAGDLITGFSSIDFFAFTSTEFGGIAAGTLAAADFQSRATDNFAQDATDRFIYRNSDDTLWFDATGGNNTAAGAADAILIAQILTNAVVTAADIQIV